MTNGEEWSLVSLADQEGETRPCFPYSMFAISSFGQKWFTFCNKSLFLCSGPSVCPSICLSLHSCLYTQAYLYWWNGQMRRVCLLFLFLHVLLAQTLRSDLHVSCQAWFPSGHRFLHGLRFSPKTSFFLVDFLPSLFYMPFNKKQEM